MYLIRVAENGSCYLKKINFQHKKDDKINFVCKIMAFV